MNSRILIYIVSSLILLTTTGCFTEQYYLADRDCIHFYQEDIRFVSDN